MTSIAAFTESSGRTQLFDRPLQKHLRGESTKEGALLDLLVPQNWSILESLGSVSK